MCGSAELKRCDAVGAIDRDLRRRPVVHARSAERFSHRKIAGKGKGGCVRLGYIELHGLSGNLGHQPHKQSFGDVGSIGHNWAEPKATAAGALASVAHEVAVFNNGRRVERRMPHPGAKEL